MRIRDWSSDVCSSDLVDGRAAAAQAVEPAAAVAVPGVRFEKGEGAVRAVEPEVAEAARGGMGEDEDLPRLNPPTRVIIAARRSVGRELLDEGAVTRIEAGGGPERQQDVAGPGAEARCGKSREVLGPFWRSEEHTS